MISNTLSGRSMPAYSRTALEVMRAPDKAAPANRRRPPRARGALAALCLSSLLTGTPALAVPVPPVAPSLAGPDLVVKVVISTVPRPKPGSYSAATPVSDRVTISADHPLPTAKPLTATGSVRVASARAPAPDAIAPQQGDLKDALDALRRDDFEQAIAIRNGMRPTLARRIVDWQLARSGSRTISSEFITRFVASAGDWPDADLLRKRAEAALLRENPSPRVVLSAFGSSKPQSIDGAIILARALVATGNSRRAHAIIAPFWRETRMSNNDESTVLREFGSVLTRADHKARADAMLYMDRTRDALAVAKYLSGAERALVNARVAVIRREKNAEAKLRAVPASMRKDPGYIFSYTQFLRRAERIEEAATMINRAPRDRAHLVNPDEWWVERRVLSRELLDVGKPREAYRVASHHAAESNSKFAEAEFHCGWYALRFLNDPRQAKAHFERIAEIGRTPITLARANYWIGRAVAAGASGSSRSYYEKAARYPGTYYGQLARAELGKTTVGIGRPPSATSTDRAAFNANPEVQAIKALAAAGHSYRSLPLFMHLADNVPTVGQARLLSDLASRLGEHRYTLIVGKAVANRWLAAAPLAFPTTAIPHKIRVRHGVGAHMVYAVARQESAFEPTAVSHAGARGLLQLLPSTAKITARKAGLPYSRRRLTSDPAYNAALGAAHLSDLVDDFGGSYIMTFAGYNAGPRRVTEWVERYGDPRSSKVDAVDWVERIPYTETRNYVQRVMENLQVYNARLNGGRLTIKQDLKRGR